MLTKECIPQMKDWLVKRASFVSDAEPDVLADYIIALLNNRSQGEELIKVLSSELAVFVSDHDSFAREVVQVLDSRAFANGPSAEELKKKATHDAVALTEQYFKPDLTSYNQAPPDYQCKHQHQAPQPTTTNADAAKERQVRMDKVEALVCKYPVARSTQLVVAQIPVDKLDELMIRSFFTRFGAINSVVVDPALRMAEIDFADHTSARKAWSSHTPMLDNRFVKVYFKKEDDFAPPFDVEAFKLKQEGKQRQFEEKQAKKKAHDEKLRQLIGLKESLLADFEKQLQQLEQELITYPEREADIRTKVENIQGRMLSEQITPDAISEDKAKLEGRPLYSLRGRGRGALRGRGGSFSPYQRPQNAYNRNLDLRTRTVTLKNLDDPENESFQRAIGVFGKEHILEVSKKDKGVNVTFTNRYIAERFYNETIELKNLPPLEKQWDDSMRPKV